MTPHEIHNRDAERIVAEIIKPTLDAGGNVSDVLVLLETVVAGVLVVTIKTGGDNRALDILIARVRERMAKIRLELIETAGGRQ